ncbi:hypothetical protein LINGRAHAP2_LOCUS20983 [Linum grandiflorum]
MGREFPKSHSQTSTTSSEDIKTCNSAPSPNSSAFFSFLCVLSIFYSMGNCQAVDAAAVVIQHPGGGKVEKLYCPITASQVMKTHPGHYVALLLSTTLYPPPPLSVSGTVDGGGGGAPVKLTRIKLLRPTDTLTLGRVYRLITNQEVMKGLWAKKQAKLTKTQYSETGHSGVQTTAHAQSSSSTRRRTSHQHLV